jgi:hypothetical protein
MAASPLPKVLFVGSCEQQELVHSFLHQLPIYSPLLVLVGQQGALYPLFYQLKGHSCMQFVVFIELQPWTWFFFSFEHRVSSSRTLSLS